MSTTAVPESGVRMSRLEIRASASLASIFALRMLGMFLILPVFAVHAKSMPGGQSAALIGLALGMYGLTQAFGPSAGSACTGVGSSASGSGRSTASSAGNAAKSGQCRVMPAVPATRP